jgi:septal ring factor EnvC (AmiA/AmiB activator)
MASVNELRQEQDRLQRQLAEEKQRPEIEELRAENQRLRERLEEVKDNAAAAEFMAHARRYRDAHKCSMAQAVDKCVNLYPDLHARMSGRAAR